MEIKKRVAISKPRGDPSTVTMLLVFAIMAISGMMYGINSNVVREGNVRLNVVDGYKSVNPGEDVLVEASLTNLGSRGREDIILEFRIDCDGDNFYKKTETLAIETSTGVVRRLQTPQNIPSGSCDVLVVMSSLDGEMSGVASESFVVFGKNENIFARLFSFLRF